MSCFGIDRSKGMVFMRLTPDDPVAGASLTGVKTATGNDTPTSSTKASPVMSSSASANTSSDESSSISPPSSSSGEDSATSKSSGSTSSANDTSHVQMSKVKPLHPEQSTAISSVVERPEATIGASAQACAAMANASVEARGPYGVSRSGTHVVLDKIGYQPSFEPQKNRMVSVLQNLDAFEKDLYKNNAPTAYKDFMLDQLVTRLDSVLGRIRRQERLKPSIQDTLSVVVEVPDHALIDSPEAVSTMLDAIAAVVDMKADTPGEPVLSLGAQGYALGREGSPLWLNIHVAPLKRVYIIDTLALGQSSFDTPSSDRSGRITLEDIFKSSTVRKLVFDCRFITEALYHWFGVSLAGIVDLQLMKIATSKKASCRRKMLGLSSETLRQAQFPGAFAQNWGRDQDWAYHVRDYGAEAADKAHAESKGDYKVFLSNEARGFRSAILSKNECTSASAHTAATPAQRMALSPPPALTQRPLHPFLIKHYVGSVFVLPQLYEYCVGHKFWNGLWEAKVKKEVGARLSYAFAVAPERRHEGVAPKGWDAVEQVDKTLAVESE